MKYSMRIIEKCWVDLKTGYQTALSLETRLKSEWQRAIQVAQRREELAANARRGQIRNIAGIAFLVFLFSCVLFWFGVYYLPENRIQFLAWSCALAFPGVASGAVYIFHLGNGSRKRTVTPPSSNLMEGWWELLRQKRYVIRKHGHRGEVEFLKSLSFLGNDYIAVWGLLTSAKKGETSDTDVLLLGPNGIWVFEVKYWSGTVSKSNGVWTQEKAFYQKGGIPVVEKTSHQPGPDEQWLSQKAEIIKTIRMRMPTSKAWLSETIAGGIVFAHEDVVLGPIAGHRAAYGTPGQWHKKIRQTPSIQGFGLEDRLQVLDALIHYANDYEREVVKIVSANTEAKRLYEETSGALHDYVSARVK